MAEVFELHESFRVARAGRAAVERVAHPRGLCGFRRGAALPADQSHRTRQQGVRVPVDPARSQAADRLPHLRHRLHAGKPDRRLHGLLGRGVRGVLHLWPGARMPARDGVSMTAIKRAYPRPLDLRGGRIDLTHGSGGRAMAQLIEELFEARFDNPWLAERNDQACFEVPGGRMVMTTDGFVISPLFFPGGDIGSLAVHGTIYYVPMARARPLYLACGMILEEGFPLADLRAIVASMAGAAKAAGVPIVTGDTKVVERGKGDGVFITTTGVGVVPEGVDIAADR